MEEARSKLFNSWSETYDRDVATDAFPFIGYWDILATVLREAAVEPGLAVLELGPGTGNLTAQLTASGCRVWGLDFSKEMLTIARNRAPGANLLQGDLLGEWPDEVNSRKFDRILSTYLFHEFKLPVKVDLLQQIAANHLNPGGRIVIGDIAFLDARSRQEMQARFPDAWDEEEEFWAAEQDLPALETVGLRTNYIQVSSCGGVIVVKPNSDDYDVPGVDIGISVEEINAIVREGRERDS